MTKKTLEEYQIQELAKAVFQEAATDFIRRGEYDVYITKNDNALVGIAKDIGTLQRAEEERVKDKKTYKYQFSGIALGFLLQFIVWAIVVSNGFKIG